MVVMYCRIGRPLQSTGQVVLGSHYVSRGCAEESYSLIIGCALGVSHVTIMHSVQMVQFILMQKKKKDFMLMELLLMRLLNQSLGTQSSLNLSVD